MRDEKEKHENNKLEQLKREAELVKIEQEQLALRLKLISTNLKNDE